MKSSRAVARITSTLVDWLSQQDDVTTVTVRDVEGRVCIEAVLSDGSLMYGLTFPPAPPRSEEEECSPQVATT